MNYCEVCKINAAILHPDSAWSCSNGSCRMWNEEDLKDFLSKGGDFTKARAIIETFLKHDGIYLKHKYLRKFGL
jgi:hypothetical protein